MRIKAATAEFEPGNTVVIEGKYYIVDNVLDHEHMTVRPKYKTARNRHERRAADKQR